MRGECDHTHEYAPVLKRFHVGITLALHVQPLHDLHVHMTCMPTATGQGRCNWCTNACCMFCHRTLSAPDEGGVG